MINFNTLPTQKPSNNTILPKGHYDAKITDAKMKQPKDPGKPEYLSMMFEVHDPISKEKVGDVFINLFESTAPLVLYQISRFIKALNLPITGDFELKDLSKMVVGKELEVDLMPEEPQPGKTPQRTVLDISAECFYAKGSNPAEGSNSPEEDWEFPEPLTAAPDNPPTTAAPQSSY